MILVEFWNSGSVRVHRKEYMEYPEIELSVPVVVIPETTADFFTVIRVVEEPGKRLYVQYKIDGVYRDLEVYNEENFDANWTDEIIINSIKAQLGVE